MNFFKLLAYIDEYEVARMLTDPTFLELVKAQVPGRRGLTYKLHPPMLKALGRKKKVNLGPRTHFALRLLAKKSRCAANSSTHSDIPGCGASSAS